MPDPLLLKKYPNRRLYDTEQSRYVTLEQVRGLIREGRRVMVRDAKSDEDVTAFILTQIVMEQARTQGNTLPVSLLHLFIRFGEDLLNDFFDSYLEKVLQSYLLYRKNMDDQFSMMLGMGMDFTRMAQRTMTEANPLAAIWGAPVKSEKTETSDE